MKKNFTLCTTSLARLMAVVAVVLTGLTAHAADPTDLGALQVGVTYTIPGNWADVYGTFTAPASGKVTLKGGGMRVYVDDTYAKEEPTFGTDGYGDAWKATFQGVEGTTYYLKKAGFNAWAEETMTIFMEGMESMPLAIEYTNPTVGTVFDLTTNTDLVIKFNQGIKLAANNAFWICTKTQADQAAANNSVTYGTDMKVTINARGTQWSAPAADRIKTLLTRRAMTPGEPFWFYVMGVTTEDGNTHPDVDANGFLKLEFIAPSLPLTLTNSVCPAEFKSYWAPGDPDAKFELTFSGNVGQSDKTFLELGFGNREGADGAFYTEKVPLTFDGNKISADLSGVLRTPATMVPLFADSYGEDFTGVMEMKLNGVVDQYGNYAQSTQQGNIGSFSFSPAYKLIPRTSVACEFTPASGTSLLGVDQVEVYIQGANAFTFAGFDFTYTAKNADNEDIAQVVNVPASLATSVKDSETETTWTVPVPEAVKGIKGVTISLSGVETLDGYDHSNDVSATYDTFVVTYADPANGSEMAVLEQGALITINTNYAETYPQMYIVYEIEDLNPENKDEAIIKSQSWLNRQEDGSYQAEVWGNYKLKLGHTYAVRFTAWENEMAKNYREEPLGTYTIYWEGLTAPFRFSDFALTSISPEPSDDYIMPLTQESIDVEFDGLVRLADVKVNLGFGATKPLVATAVDGVENDGETFSSKWTIALPADFMSTLTAAMDVTFQAYDAEGLLLPGTQGVEENARYYYSYQTEGQFHDFDVEVGDNSGQYTSVKTFKAICPEGIDISYSKALNSAIVYDMDRAQVAAVAESKTDDSWMTGGGSDDLNTWVELTLDTEITTPGKYVLIIPNSYFAIGTEFNAFRSAEKTVPFTVSESIFNYSVEPAEGSHTRLEAFTFTFEKKVKRGTATGAPAFYAADGRNTRFRSVAFETAADEYGNTLTLTLRAPLNELGNGYYVHIPEGFLMDEAGKDVPEIKAYYNLVAEPVRPNFTVDPEEGTVSSLKDITLTFTDFSEIGLGAGKATLTVNDGEAIELGDAELDFDIWNKAVQSLGQEYTASGIYKISFPEGYFVDDNYESIPAFDLVYTIDAPAPDPYVCEPAPGAVENLTKITITFPDYDEVGIGAGFATIQHNAAEPQRMPDAELSWEPGEENLIIQDMPGGIPVTATGNYTVRFPAGYVLMGSQGVESPEIVLLYVINQEGASVNGIHAINDGKTRVYNMQGVLLLETENADDVKALRSGLYILNGNKVVIK